MREPAGPFVAPLDPAVPLAEQLSQRVRAAIESGQLPPGARLPSWRDLATQLGVARGTVREAYERLAAERLIVASGAAGTHVARRGERPLPSVPSSSPAAAHWVDFRPSSAPLPFQVGVPAQDAFPAKQWARLSTAAARSEAFAPTSYADPRGEPALRIQLAAYLAIARGLPCAPEQILVTSGFRGGLALALTTLALAGRRAWVEDPGYPRARQAVTAAGLLPVPIEVDDEGIDVAQGIARADDAALAIVTPGQQAPLGVPLSRRRREALLRWAERAGSWIIEDDYLSELQLDGRAAASLASEDRHGRVLHIGTFSKTLSPALGIGFLVAPPSLVPRAEHVARCLLPAPARTTQHAIAALMAEGHYLRHLRRMKRLYAARRDALIEHLGQGRPAGLAVLLELPAGTDDVAIAQAARAHGLGPVALSPFYEGDARAGLLLGVANMTRERLVSGCAALRASHVELARALAPETNTRR